MFSKINNKGVVILIHNMEIGAFFQCYKNPYATYKCLESFRHFYPTSTVVLLSDNGFNYSAMASYFNCIYVHCYENVKFIHTDLETGSHISNTYKLIDRIKTAFEIIKEEHIIWLEDDVVINGHIDTEFNFDLNGFCPNTINQSSIVALSCKYDLIDSRRNYRFSGHGGSVYKKSALLECFKNKSAIDDILENWKIYGFPTTLCQDYLFSLLLTIHGKTVGPYVGHGETIEPRPMPSLTVQHQYKRWYGVPMPSELRKLVSDS